MNELAHSLRAGMTLRKLIQENYNTQEEFALDYGMELRTVNRYVNEGIKKVDIVQELAHFFGVEFVEFFREN